MRNFLISGSVKKSKGRRFLLGTALDEQKQTGINARCSTAC